MAVPTAETKKKMAERIRTFLRPNRSLNGPAPIAPRAQPSRATAHGPALLPGIEREMRLQRPDGAVDDARVVAEQQAAQCGHEGDHQDIRRAADLTTRQLGNPPGYHIRTLVHCHFGLSDEDVRNTHPTAPAMSSVIGKAVWRSAFSGSEVFRRSQLLPTRFQAAGY